MNLNLIFKSHYIEIRFVIIFNVLSYLKNTKDTLIESGKKSRVARVKS